MELTTIHLQYPEKITFLHNHIICHSQFLIEVSKTSNFLRDDLLFEAENDKLKELQEFKLFGILLILMIFGILLKIIALNNEKLVDKRVIQGKNMSFLKTLFL